MWLQYKSIFEISSSRVDPYIDHPTFTNFNSLQYYKIVYVMEFVVGI